MSAFWASGRISSITRRWRLASLSVGPASQEPAKGKILFVNAVNEVIRERAQSFLTDDHIAHIVSAYRAFQDEAGFARVVRLDEVRRQGGALNIPLYVGVAPAATNGESNGSSGAHTLAAWIKSASESRAAPNCIFPTMALPAEVRSLNAIRKYYPEWLKRAAWKRLPFGAFAEIVNERVELAEAADAIYVGLDDLDPADLHIRRWGKASDVIGTKLRFQKADIIFGRRRAYQRKLAVAEVDGICSAHAMVVGAKPEIVLPEFLPFMMMSDRSMTRAVEISVGPLSPTINWTTLNLEEFDLPPLDEQARIAEILWTADSAEIRLITLREEISRMETAWLAETLGGLMQRNRMTTVGEISEFITTGSRGWAEDYSQRGTPVRSLSQRPRPNT